MATEGSKQKIKIFEKEVPQLHAFRPCIKTILISPVPLLFVDVCQFEISDDENQMVNG